MRRYRTRRRDHGDVNTVTLKTRIDTVRVFVKWLEASGGCPPDLAAKNESPSITPEEYARDVEVHSDDAAAMHAYLEKYRYAGRRHVTVALLWHTTMRRGQGNALDL